MGSPRQDGESVSKFRRLWCNITVTEQFKNSSFITEIAKHQDKIIAGQWQPLQSFDQKSIADKFKIQPLNKQNRHSLYSANGYSAAMSHGSTLNPYAEPFIPACETGGAANIRDDK